MRRLGLVIIVLALALVGCVQQRPPLDSSTPVNALPKGSAVGEYSAGQKVVFATGASVRVPDGWTARVLSPGALSASAPIASEATGAILDVSAQPRWGAAIVRAYSNDDGFNRELSAANSAYRVAQAGYNDQPYSIVRTPVHLSEAASATAFVMTWPGSASRRAIDLFVQQPGELPLEIAVELDHPPAALAKASPPALLEWMLSDFSFSPR